VIETSYRWMKVLPHSHAAAAILYLKLYLKLWISVTVLGQYVL